MELEKYYEIHDFLLHQRYPPRCKSDKGRKKNFRSVCKKYTLLDNLLFYSYSGKNLRVVKEDEVKQLINSLHTEEHGGHVGVSKS